MRVLGNAVHVSWAKRVKNLLRPLFLSISLLCGLSFVDVASATGAETLNDALLVEKQVFTMERFTTFGGKHIESVNVGWEAYGELSENKDNVILITHYFSGTSHAAGKYKANDSAPGYWDSLIGPGKAIDTNRFYVVSVDTLVNLNAYDDNVITTGPASINPKTGKPYGLTFPVVTIRDFVNVQKALLESLGINKLHAVVGPSMGSMQAIDWASAYPNWVDKVISVIGTAESDAWTTSALEHWATPIKLDPHWNNGEYEKSNAPVDGLTAALMLVTQNALTPDFFNSQGNTLAFKNIEQAPLQDIQQTHSIVNWLKARAATRSKNMDANHLLYLVRACQLFVAGHQETLQAGLEKINAKTLFIPSASDLLLMPYLSSDANQALKKLNKDSALITIDGELGHIEGVSNAAKQASAIRAFLEE